MIRDMRDWIELLQAHEELIEIEKEVDVKDGMGALIFDSREKALLFRNLKGHPSWRALAQAPANTRHCGMAFGVPAQDVVAVYAEKVGLGGTPCKLVSSAPVKEVIRLGKEVDLNQIPVHVTCEEDGGPYIGSGLCIVRDPETGYRNMTLHRLQIKGRDKTGILARTETHLWKAYQKYEGRGEAMPMAVAIGHSPSLYFAATFSGPAELDEMELAGTLAGEPVEVVKCETIDLEVPARAEIVLEGEIPPHIREEEGPYGEFTGYFTSAMGKNPIFQLKGITMRKDAIYKAMNSFRTENAMYATISLGASLYKDIKDIGGGIDLKTVHVLPELFTVIIQLTPRFHGEAKNCLLAALSGNYLHPKVAIAVDEDVDVYELSDVLWAISTRVNPAEDVLVIPGTRGHPMDISLRLIELPGTKRWQRVGSKLAIDATKPSPADPERQELFRRLTPKGWPKVRPKDYIS